MNPGTASRRRGTAVRLRAVGFDLDDTLYDHAQYVAGAYRNIAAAVHRLSGIDEAAFFERIFADWQARTSRCDRIFADALKAHGLYSADLERQLVRTYRAHPPALTPHPGVRAGLHSLKQAGFRLGLLTDGQLEVQQRKVRALGLEDAFDVAVYTGALGREFYKPHEAGFRQLVAHLEVQPGELALVGDNPITDFESAKRMGMYTIRVLTGEYRHLHPQLEWVDRNCATVGEAIAWLLTCPPFKPGTGAAA